MSNKATNEAAANVIVKAVSLGLMSWAAIETSGFLRWALVGYIVLTVATMAGLAGFYAADARSSRKDAA